MTYPPDEHMVILLALHPAACESIVIGDDDRPRLAGIGVPVNLDIVDALAERGWVEHTETGPVVTDKGAYWLRRWMDAKLPKGSRFKRLAARC